MGKTLVVASSLSLSVSAPCHDVAQQTGQDGSMVQPSKRQFFCSSLALGLVVDSAVSELRCSFTCPGSGLQHAVLEELRAPRAGSWVEVSQQQLGPCCLRLAEVPFQSPDILWTKARSRRGQPSIQDYASPA